MHEGINDGRADEAEAALTQGFAQCDALGRLRREIGQGFELVDQRPASQRRTVRLGAEGFNLVPALDAEPTSALSW